MLTIEQLKEEHKAIKLILQILEKICSELGEGRCRAFGANTRLSQISAIMGKKKICFFQR